MDRGFVDRAGLLPMLPLWAAGGSPDDLVVTRAGGAVPSEGRVIVEIRCLQLNVRGPGRRRGERCQGSSIQTCDIGNIVKIDVIKRVAIVDTVFRADVLVLPGELFAIFGEAYCRES